ncbi:hypothetical protein [Halomonas sp.]
MARSSRPPLALPLVDEVDAVDAVDASVHHRPLEGRRLILA